MDGGVASVAPFCAMVDVAAGWWLVAAGISASTIAHGDGAADAGGDGAGRAFDVQRFGVGVEDGGDHRAVTGQHP